MAGTIETGAPPLEAERPDLPKRLLNAIGHALANDPRKRPPAGALAKELRSALGDRRRVPAASSRRPDSRLARRARTACRRSVRGDARRRDDAPLLPRLLGARTCACGRVSRASHPSRGPRAGARRTGPAARERRTRARASLRRDRARLARALMGGRAQRARVPGRTAARPARTDRARAAGRSAGQRPGPPRSPDARGGRSRRARRRATREPSSRSGRALPEAIDVAGTESAV